MTEPQDEQRWLNRTGRTAPAEQRAIRGDGVELGEYVQQWSSVHAIRESDLTITEVWVTYWSMNGQHDETEVDAYLTGLLILPSLERDLVAHAINDLIEDLGLDVDGAHYSTGGVADDSGFSEYLRPLTLTPDGYRFDRPAITAPHGINDIGSATARQEVLDEVEVRRCHALYESGLLDTGSEDRFDALTAQTRERFGTSSASIALITEDRQVIKSVVGPIGSDLPREMALCAQTIETDRTLIVNDATNEPAWADHPLVTGGPCIRFYAGHPLSTPDGLRIGSLCVIDDQPRSFSDEDQRDLRLLAAQVQLEIWLGPA
ncbi:GAF domain-containing protein [Vibrio cholerae]|nr:GAF domain-containing protein [Vibrio cholerae]